MDPETWYAVGLGSLCCLLILQKVAILFRIASLTHSILCYLKCIYFSWRGRVELGLISMILIVTYFAGNILSLLFYGRGLLEIQRRAAALVVINLAPLLHVGNLYPIANWLGVAHCKYVKIHRYVGLVVLAHGFTHAAVVVQLNPRPGLVSTSGYAVSLLDILITIVTN